MRIAQAFLVFLAASPPLSALQERSPRYTIKVDVGLVVLNAAVTDSKGIPVSGLNQDNFQILEDGLPQQIKNFSRDDVPATVGLVIDNSSSMRSKRNDVVDAALVFSRSINPRDEMFVVNFNERVWFGLPSGVLFTQKLEQVEAALLTTSADGETALYDAVCAGLERLDQTDREKRVLIVISDGGDNASKHTLSDVVAMVGRPEATIYTVNLYDEHDRDNNPGVLKRMASISGGEFFRVSTVEQIIPTLQSIAHEMGSEYTITYRSNNPKQDGKFRSIKIRVRMTDGHKVFVRARTGYYAGSANGTGASGH